MSGPVVAVVVTFNRKALLTKCLDGLLQQTRVLDKIIVVDNASSDGTSALLETGGYLSNPKIDYRRLNENRGGAGGFNYGVDCAMQTPADWIWLMDDDVCPTPECLAQLFEYTDISECLHPKKILPDGTEQYWEHYFDILTARSTFISNASFQNKKICFAHAGCFEGMLISRRVIAAIGLPDAKYFISGDDTLYGIKASLHTNVVYVRDAVLDKTLAPGKEQPWKAYYYTRNRYYLHRDAMACFGLRLSKTDTVIFHVIRFMEMTQSLLKGPKFLGPTMRGVRDGLIYMYRKQS